MPRPFPALQRRLRSTSGVIKDTSAPSHRMGTQKADIIEDERRGEKTADIEWGDGVGKGGSGVRRRILDTGTGSSEKDVV
ncbi:hypothetical protein GWI33_022786 [Rhynchophorus ferrugineus]|uniref:Uncharacterized protein n=1 Tax=Rhynchophorus ferrugineus TaxID=354439 RepID=A0A834MHN4_RHYFE|nr:hypothetical protein GWI33_022786 [Rhynchophorus ferrugineus]